jgi:2,5-diketo-D-gluconate reductase A
MTDLPNVTLADGRMMPQLGLGVAAIPEADTARIVEAAIAAGYRSVDTVAAYRNETGVGEALRNGGPPRREIFVTTKLANGDQGYDEALKAFDRSLERLGLDYVDLYLIHWPAPSRGRYIDSWKALVRLQEEGRALSIGVSNFAAEHLRRIVAETGVTPVLNQVELHPCFQQGELRAFHASHGVVTESWSPLGHGRLLDHPAIGAVARKHGRSPAQVIIRWHLDEGLVAIPKASAPARLAENLAVLDFDLDADDRRAFAALDDPLGRRGPDPIVFG